MKIAAHAVGLFCPARNLKLGEERHHAGQAILLPTRGHFELPIVLFGRGSDSQQHLAFEIGGQPACDDLGEICLRISEIALRPAEEP